MLNLYKKGKGIVTILIVLFILISLGGCKQQESIGTNAIVNPKESAEGKTAAVAVRNNELVLINLSDNSTATLDNNGYFSHPLISPDKRFIAYLKDNNLYVTNRDGKKSKVCDKIDISSYIWLNNSSLIYSKDSGGIYVFNAEKSESIVFLENEFNYKNITLGTDGKTYAEKYKYYEKEGQSYRSDYGVVLFSKNDKNEQLIIKSIPADSNTLGMYPVIAGISKDGKFLLMWEHPHAGSLATDGMSFASFDTEENKYIKYFNSQAEVLGYKDNVSPSLADSQYMALIYGNNRMMNINKTLGILNLTNGSFEKLSSEEQTAMTPCYSADGKTLIYAASKKLANDFVNYGTWTTSSHYIYSINLENKQITQLTKSQDSFDFAPQYINEKDIIFLRNTSKGNVSLWKLQDGKETKVIDDLIFYADQYKAQNYYGHFNYKNYFDLK